jgi:hypothetical protein
MTLLCGDPSGRTVARCAKVGFSSRSAWLAGTSGIGFLLATLLVTVVTGLSWLPFPGQFTK